MNEKRNMYKMIEVDETTTILDNLKDDGEKLKQGVNVMTYYRVDGIDYWSDSPQFTIVSLYDGTSDIIYHTSDIDVFNDTYNFLTKNNLIERII